MLFNNVAPPTFKAPPIPAPPVTIKAPVLVEVEVVLFVNDTAPFILAFPLTSNVKLGAMFPIPTLEFITVNVSVNVD